ncbi:MAG: FGGY family carbohydrate kinase [Tissierellia bacterium]|nr:FGGY family carbohydrate kinase [Tissierellia bacterium]
MKKVLAIDLGATSGRGVVGYIENDMLKTEEVLRFSHKIIDEKNRNRWQFNKILNEIEKTIIKYNDISSVGVDTWGVDIGLLDSKGELLENPISYRDLHNEKAFKKYLEVHDSFSLFEKTGNQLLPINTYFQLYSLYLYNKNIIEDIDKILFMPDLISYFLSGEMTLEETILSTSGFYDLDKKVINKQLLNEIGFDVNLFAKKITAGKTVGSTKKSKLIKLRDYDIDVVSVCGHDTASALLVTNSFNNPLTAFLSCGTWSLVGVTASKPIRNYKAFENNISNELGFNSTNMFFKNITGLYLIEKLIDELEAKNNERYTYDDINKKISNRNNYKRIINVEDEIFSRNDTKILEFLNNEFGQLDDYLYFEIIYDSLVLKYKETLDQISKITNTKIDKLHVIGGGAKSSYLMQKIADKLHIDVLAGPYEATIYGNILIQLLNRGEIRDLKEGLDLIKKSVEYKYYKWR